MHLSIIIPAFNEEACLESVVKETWAIAKQDFPSYEIIIVNDGSLDRTLEIANQLASSLPSVRVLSKANGGIGSALRTGFSEAKGDFLIYTHADGQFDFREAKILLQEVQSCDVVFGYKKNLESYSYFRKLNSQGFRLFLVILFGIPFWDVNFVQIYRGASYRKLPIISNGVAYHAEVVIRALRNNMSVKGIPVTLHPRQNGIATGGSAKSILRTIVELLRVRFSL